MRGHDKESECLPKVFATHTRILYADIIFPITILISIITKCFYVYGIKKKLSWQFYEFTNENIPFGENIYL